MIRASLAADSRMVFHSKASNGQSKYNLIFRLSDGKDTPNNLVKLSPDRWLRLKRTCDKIMASVKGDQGEWTAYGNPVEGFGGEMYVGVAFTPKADVLSGATLSGFELNVP